MIRYVLLGVLLSAGSLLAQTKEVVDEVEARLGLERLTRQRQAEERNEDIEVLRRLLNKTFGFESTTRQLSDQPDPVFHHDGWSGVINPYSSTAGTPNPAQSLGSYQYIPTNNINSATPLPGKRVTQAIGPFDGVYLKGTGVVFTLRIPANFGAGDTTSGCVGSITGHLGLRSTCTKCHAVKSEHPTTAITSDCTRCHMMNPQVKAPAPISDWERERADLRGEKLPEPKASVTPTAKPQEVMCKPGDIRELVISQIHANGKYIRHLDKDDWITVAITFDELPGLKASRIPAPTDKPGFSPDELQSLTLADLHLKQNKFKEAVEAYEKGLTRFRTSTIRITPPAAQSVESTQRMTAEIEKSVRGMYRNLAGAYLQLNELDKARLALDQATGFKVEVAKAESSEKTKPKLPAKIVLSLAKSEIDRGVSLAEFSKGAWIEMQGVPAPAVKK